MNSPIVAAVVLAAGGGRRYGMPKALVEYEGSLLVERAVRTARAVCDPVLVVLGARAVDVWRQADLGGAAYGVGAGGQAAGTRAYGWGSSSRKPTFRVTWKWATSPSTMWPRISSVVNHSTLRLVEDMLRTALRIASSTDSVDEPTISLML